MHHYRKTVKHYRATKAKNAAAKSCPFCDRATLENALYETELSYVIRNVTEYDLWEAHQVAEHLMVIPKRHTESLQEMNDEERLDMLDIAARYEAEGYNIYARGVGASTRSVAHQHTHLIKIKDRYPKFVFHIKKPYFLIRL